MSYNKPEDKAGFTDAEFEKYGDAVLMTWRNWVEFRDKLAQMKADDGLSEFASHDMRTGYRYALRDIVREMDETLP